MNLKKKIIGILGIAIIAMALFFSTNAINGSNGEFDLLGLVSMNTANAECNNVTHQPGAYCKNNYEKNCGFCTVSSTVTSCKESTSHIKDCYDIGF
ncbi:hypothetical protein UMM65_15830 [Aureibaculum sp. 2210JD6-5]|uniref:hypothetical protein n=1 Tax=Aureibaculum sp. 2210JD6-5 TaxID=3103957 RepID=UPI002AAD319B|nr:hypothetical protein [Aureibaculum sp. 2210JD6-5]MDY7396718.1 hypothetical protein [Aureibaculum sp. 2210JD6-5]